MNPAASTIRLAVSGELELRHWEGEVLLYHVPSATTSRISPLLGAALERLREAPATPEDLCRWISGSFPDTAGLETHLEQGLKRLLQEGVLGEL